MSKEKRITDLKWLANVRRDKTLTDFKKILLMEIESLSHDKGFCYASNPYLADIFDKKDDKWISTVIGELDKSGYIKTDTDTNNKRRIYVDLFYYNRIGIPEKQNPHSTKTEYNNISQLDNYNRIKDSGTAELSDTTSHNTNNDILVDPINADLHEFLDKNNLEYMKDKFRSMIEENKRIGNPIVHQVKYFEKYLANLQKRV